jgi:hypothetical protein
VAFFVAFHDGESSRLARAAGELKVAVVGEVNSTAYPRVEAVLSVVDAITGRPVTDLPASSVTITDEAGATQVLELKPTRATEAVAATAYVVAVDTSAAMRSVGPSGKTHLQRTVELLQQFVARLGSNDQVRLVFFSSGVDTARTGWVFRGDPTLQAAIGALQTTSDRADLAKALGGAASLAQQAPSDIPRRAVVLFTATNDGRSVPAMNDQAIKDLRTPFYTFGLGGRPDQNLGLFLDNVATQSEGGTWDVDGPVSDSAALDRLFELTQRAWTVRFVADALPDGEFHDITVTVRDAAARAGDGHYRYRAGRLTKVTPIDFRGIEPDERVESDREIEVSASGGKQWKTMKLELFRDCDPGICKPAEASDGTAIKYRLMVGPLDQGSHRLTARLTVSDGEREFVDTATVRFTRGGTTFNFGVMFLFGGIAIVAIGITVVGARRRQMRMDRWR